MNWDKLLNFQRVGGSGNETFIPSRSPFNVDYDRIIFSSAFRRLDEKTQVHPLRHNDNVHSRLSHSLEVSSVGRSLGTLAGGFLQYQKQLPEHFTPDHTGQIIQTACLAHDIGNPPFGHAGEDIISSWFLARPQYLKALEQEQKNDFLHFEGNAQAFRLLTRLGMYKDNGGLRPTYAMAASLMKYPWIFHSGSNKYCSFDGEKELLKEIAEGTGLVGDKNIYCRHPFAFLSEAADDICYSIIDIEDAFELGMISFAEASEILNGICRLSAERTEGKSEKEQIAFFRAVSIGKCIDAVIAKFIEKYDGIMSGELSYKFNLLENSSVSEQIQAAKKIGRDKIYVNPRKIMIEAGAENILDVLLTNYCNAALEITAGGAKASYRSIGLMRSMGDGAVTAHDSIYTALHKVLDHISGMTDKFAAETAAMLYGIANPLR